MLLSSWFVVSVTIIPETPHLVHRQVPARRAELDAIFRVTESVFAHVPLAIALQSATVLLARLLGVGMVQGAWLGAFCAITVCVAREITQREYQWIERHGGGLRRNMPLFAGYRFWEWNRHSKRETLGAVLLVCAIATLATLV